MINPFLKTFGYFICRGGIELNAEIEEEYDYELSYVSKINSKNSNILEIPTAVNYAMERGEKLSEKILTNSFKEIIYKILSENFYYWGSDLSTFTRSSDWHRDCYTKFPIYKALIYLDGSYGDDQTFLCIPGTHHVKDNYANRIGKSGRWPYGSGFELNYLQGIYDYKKDLYQPTLPSQQIKIQRGDIIIFDQRMFHAVIANSEKKRRLIAISVIPNFKTAMEVSYELPETEDEYKQLLHEARCAFFSVDKNRVPAPMSQKDYIKVPSFIREKMLWADKDELEYLDMINKKFKEPESQIRGMNIVNYYNSGIYKGK